VAVPSREVSLGAARLQLRAQRGGGVRRVGRDHERRRLEAPRAKSRVEPDRELLAHLERGEREGVIIGVVVVRAVSEVPHVM
jgi:hypothetical protein